MESGLSEHGFRFFFVIVTMMFNPIPSFLNSLDNFLRFLWQPQSKILQPS